MSGQGTAQPRRLLLKLLRGRTVRRERRVIPSPDDELIKLSEVLLAELSRPLTDEERSHGWDPQLQRRMRRWVKEVGDRYRKGMIPGHVSGPISFALPMAWDSVKCKLVEFDYLLGERIMAATGQGIDQIRDDLEELADLSEKDPETAAEIRAAIRDYDEARARRQGGGGASGAQPGT